MDTNEPMLTGLFRDREGAERAYQSVSDRGYGRDDVNVVMSDETRKRHFSKPYADVRDSVFGTKAAEAPASAARSAAASARSPRRSPPSARRSRCRVSASSSPGRSRLRSPARAPAPPPAASSAR